MASRRRKKSSKSIKTASGSCRFGKVKVGKRKGQCRKAKPRRRAA